MKIVGLSAGLSQPSSSRLLLDRLVAATGAEEVQVVELRELGHDLVNHLVTRVASSALQQAMEAVAEADALVVVTPVFNGSYAGLFKMFFEVLDEGTLRGKPLLMAATGGTARHSLAIDQAMLPLFFYLKAAIVPTAVFAATDDWGDDSGLARRVEQAASELVQMVSGEGRVQRPARKPSDDFTLEHDFETMMSRL
ncbi:MAG TPA: NAD(P)H-dependent oxidoreductase [Candidatus Luteococcus avicola]|nr:NAD(P)H-dependent oxidoreductase [Candidatus Luteococcus avicola]